MAKAKKKRAIYGEYVITVETESPIKVSRIYDNVLGSLRKIAEAKGIEFNPDWTTRQFGKKIADDLGDGKIAEVGEYTVLRESSGGVKTYRVYDNAKGAPHEVAEKTVFEFDNGWTTRQFGSKPMDILNGALRTAATGDAADFPDPGAGSRQALHRQRRRQPRHSRRGPHGQRPAPRADCVGQLGPLGQARHVCHADTDCRRRQPQTPARRGARRHGPGCRQCHCRGRARNRRTEIVLSPKVDKILEAL